MTRRPRLSLRTHLLLFGLAATVIPIVVLLGTVFATSTSEEVFEEAPEQQQAGTTTAAETSVPVIVPVVAVGLAAAAAVAVWRWSARAVRPMTEIAAVAEEIQAGSLDRRIGLAGEAREVQDLGDSFDRMLDRLERSSRTQHQLIEDTSHELRTPLAALAVNNEVIRARTDATSADYRASLDRSDALIRRLQLTIDELLRDARQRTEHTRQVDNDLVQIVERVADQHRAVRPDVALVVTAPAQCRLAIDGPSIERALTNLVENASRFSPPGAPIEVVVEVGPATLSVTDHGPGIAPEDQSRVFDRYYRADATDGNGNGDASGKGIGLALVKQVAEAHGSIHIESPVPNRDRGTRFVISFADDSPADGL